MVHRLNVFPPDVEHFIDEWESEVPIIEVQTSGSTGIPKKMWVEKEKMKASARMTCRFLGLREGDTALLCMPVAYIAGKMVVVRAITHHLRLYASVPSGHPLQNLDFTPDFAAMVPSQVFNSTTVRKEFELLLKIRHLIIGGGSVSPEIESRIKDAPNAIWSTYGMTETLSHIALRKLNGKDASSWYTPLPGVTLSESEEHCLRISAPHVCDDLIETNDYVEFNRDGGFRIIGRKDNTICSGGVKIQIEKVENLLNKYITIPFAITAFPDAKFGEAVTLVFQENAADTEMLIRICRNNLPAHWIPKHYLPFESIPLTPTGKPARKTIKEQACRMCE